MHGPTGFLLAGTLSLSKRYSAPNRPRGEKLVRLILLIIIIILLIGALPTWPYSAGWGYYPAGGIGTLLIILLILALVGVI